MRQRRKKRWRGENSREEARIGGERVEDENKFSVQLLKPILRY